LLPARRPVGRQTPRRRFRAALPGGFAATRRWAVRLPFASPVADPPRLRAADRGYRERPGPIGPARYDPGPLGRVAHGTQTALRACIAHLRPVSRTLVPATL